jgi:dipeptidyl aminopeptidase/acylaminoacyl peptidase
MRRFTLALCLALCASQVLSAEPSVVRRTLTADDFYSVQDVSDPQVSPDGQWVAYLVTSNDRESDSALSAVWMVSWDGGQRLALSTPSEGTAKPRWSPDGRYLAFLSTPPGSEKSQLMLMDRRGGEARQVAKTDGDIAGYSWSSNGRQIALVINPAAPTLKPIVIDAIHFKQDEEGYLGTGRNRHLFLFDLETQHLDALTTDPQFNEDLPIWSPDGRLIAFVRTRETAPDQDGRADIDIIEARPGAAVKTLARPFAPNSQKLGWNPTGAAVTFLQGGEPKFNAYMQDHLFFVPVNGGEPGALTGTLDRAVTSYAFPEDSAGIYITAEDDGGAYPASVPLSGGAVSPLVPAGPFVVSELSTARGHTALLKSADHELAEVYALESGRLRKLTVHNDAFLAERQLGAVEDIKFKSKDGAEIHGLIVKPPSYVAGQKYPTVLWIHGGPNGQDEHSLVLDGYQFEPQMFAAKGFIVLRVNYRGGSGRGLAFAKTIYADWGHKEVEDLLAGVDSLVARGLADRDRLAVGGWSYGGILTDYTIATDRRFKAAISGAGSANQLATYGSDEYVLQYNNELGPPWRNTALWLKVSYPFFHADRIHTPTLFLGGDKDFNVPIIGGEQMYQSLRTLGVPAQLVVYPGQHHVFTRPSFVKDLAERMSAWLDRYVTSSQ